MMDQKSFGRKRSRAHRDTNQEITCRGSVKRREISRKIAHVQFEIQIGCHWNPNLQRYCYTNCKLVVNYSSQIFSHLLMINRHTTAGATATVVQETTNNRRTKTHKTSSRSTANPQRYSTHKKWKEITSDFQQRLKWKGKYTFQYTLQINLPKLYFDRQLCL